MTTKPLWIHTLWIHTPWIHNCRSRQIALVMVALAAIVIQSMLFLSSSVAENTQPPRARLSPSAQPATAHKKAQNFEALYQLSRAEIKKQPLSQLRTQLASDCAARIAKSCARLCVWQAMDRETKNAASTCDTSCRQGTNATCYIGKLAAQETKSQASLQSAITALLLDSTCPGQTLTSCNPVEIRKNINRLANSNSELLAWSVALGCLQGKQESCQLARYLKSSEPLDTGGQDYLSSLLDYTCDQRSAQACAVSAMLRGYNDLPLFGR